MSRLFLCLTLFSGLSGSVYADSAKAPYLSDTTKKAFSSDPGGLALNVGTHHSSQGPVSYFLPIVKKDMNHVWWDTGTILHGSRAGYRKVIRQPIFNQYWFVGFYAGYNLYAFTKKESYYLGYSGVEIASSDQGQLTINLHAPIDFYGHTHSLWDTPSKTVCKANNWNLLSSDKKEGSFKCIDDKGASIKWTFNVLKDLKISLLGSLSYIGYKVNDRFHPKLVWSYGVGGQYALTANVSIQGHLLFNTYSKESKPWSVGVRYSESDHNNNSDLFQGRLKRPPEIYIPQYGELKTKNKAKHKPFNSRVDNYARARSLSLSSNSTNNSENHFLSDKDSHTFTNQPSDKKLSKVKVDVYSPRNTKVTNNKTSSSARKEANHVSTRAFQPHHHNQQSVTINASPNSQPSEIEGWSQHDSVNNAYRKESDDSLKTSWNEGVPSVPNTTAYNAVQQNSSTNDSSTTYVWNARKQPTQSTQPYERPSVNVDHVSQHMPSHPSQPPYYAGESPSRQDRESDALHRAKSVGPSSSSRRPSVYLDSEHTIVVEEQDRPTIYKVNNFKVAAEEYVQSIQQQPTQSPSPIKDLQYIDGGSEIPSHRSVPLCDEEALRTRLNRESSNHHRARSVGSSSSNRKFSVYSDSQDRIFVEEQDRSTTYSVKNPEMHSKKAGHFAQKKQYSAQQAQDRSSHGLKHPKTRASSRSADHQSSDRKRYANVRDDSDTDSVKANYHRERYSRSPYHCNDGTKGQSVSDNFKGKYGDRRRRHSPERRPPAHFSKKAQEFFEKTRAQNAFKARSTSSQHNPSSKSKNGDQTSQGKSGKYNTGSFNFNRASQSTSAMPRRTSPLFVQSDKIPNELFQDEEIRLMVATKYTSETQNTISNLESFLNKYEIKGSEAKELQKAYRKAMLKYAPNASSVNTPQEGESQEEHEQRRNKAAECFIHIKQAFDVLLQVKYGVS